jgi:hypothetical protein
MRDDSGGLSLTELTHTEVTEVTEETPNTNKLPTSKPNPV